MLLSIVVPICNAEQFLPKCIESILNQTFQDFELILVDDGSTDDSLAVCRRYEQKDSRVKVIHKENGGAVSARKAGVKNARGNYVGMVDADDWLDTDYYQKLVSGLVDEQVDIVICDNTVDFGDHSLIIRQGILPGIYDKKRLLKDVYPRLAFSDRIYTLGISPSLCTKIIRRDIIVKCQDLVANCIKGGDDAACAYPAILDAEKMVYVDECYGYYYRVHNASMTHKVGVLLDKHERIMLLSHMMREMGRYKYEGVQRQIGLYALAVIEELLFNYVENRIYRKHSMMKALNAEIVSHPVWSLIKTYVGEEEIPMATGVAMNYLERQGLWEEMRIIGIIKGRSIKKYVKSWLVKVRVYGRRRETRM